MKEQIQRDREMLKNNTQNSPDFSYIPLLQSKPSTRARVKLSKLSTLNILVYLEEGFQKSDKHMLNNIERIKREVARREDLFEAILNYLENKKVRDNLFYWTPGYKISNIFCFIVDLLPNFVGLYKEYYIERVVCRKKLCDASTFVKERFSADYEQFNLMSIDLSMFSFCISAHIWSAECSFSLEQTRALDQLRIVGLIDISDDIEAQIAPSASFVDMTVNGCEYTIRLDALVGLMTKDEKYRMFWARVGVDLSNGIDIVGV